MRRHNIVLTEQAEWKYSVEATPDGADASASIAYETDFNTVFSGLPAIGSAHPSIANLFAFKIDVDRQEGLKARVVVSYKPNKWTATYPGRPDRETDGKRYNLEISTREEPLLTNYLFKDLTETEKRALREYLASNKDAEARSAVQKDVSSEVGLKAIDKINKGIESYFNPGMVWVERFKTENASDAQISNTAKTTSSPPGPCPSSGTERNWLYLGCTASMGEDGKTWEMERRWQLSERGKWDSDLYPAAS